MELIIRVALTFFFIQFSVVLTIMTVALLFARQAEPTLGRAYEFVAIKRTCAFVIHLPNRIGRSVVRLVRSMHLRSVY
jgi:hypothetical protein